MARPSRPRVTASSGLRQEAAGLALGLLIGTTALAAIGQAALGFDARYPWRVSALLTGMLAAAAPGLLAHHPFPRLGPANRVTAARACAVALLAGLATAPSSPPPSVPMLVLAVAAALADLADGWLARRTRLVSRFGARADMEVDALFILVLAVLVWRTTAVGAWVMTAGLLRYGFVAAGWIWPWMRAELPPSRRRQTLCVVQVVTLIVPLTPGLPAAIGLPVAAAGVLLLWASFAIDTRWLAQARVARVG